MTGSVQDVDKGWNAVLRNIDWINDNAVKVGIQGNAGKESNGADLITVAAVQEFGATINHGGGTGYILDAIVGKGRNARYVGTRFVSKRFAGRLDGVTSAHKIVIPARPFMRTTATDPTIQRGFNSMVDRFVAEILTGKGPHPQQVLGQLGEWYQNRMREVLRDAKRWVPNKPATIRRKKSNKPLLDHGVLVNAIRWAWAKAPSSLAGNTVR